MLQRTNTNKPFWFGLDQNDFSRAGFREESRLAGISRLLSQKIIHAAALLFLIWGAGSVCLKAGEPIADANPLEMPAVGSYGLRVLSPTLLEMTLITTKDPDPAPVTQWNFVGDNFSLQLPPPSDFQVTANGQAVPALQAGFKRRVLYAPLKVRDLRIGNYLYLQLASPLPDGATVTVSNPAGDVIGAGMTFQATADPLRWSPVVHVNQVGYAPSAPKKAMVGYYLGSLGEMPIPTQAGFNLVDASSGAVVFQGTLTLRPDVGYTYSPTPYQQVWQADFSSFTIPGRYRLQVPGLGASFPFLIDDGDPAAFARTFALGLFNQRCGEDLELPFTRFVHGACHTAPASVPTMAFAEVNNVLAEMTANYANYQTAPQLKDVDSSLYPFVRQGTVDVSGGHHDAGDYSKYTIDSAGMIHFLVFAADSFPGAGDLDNLGIPESGDGKSDLLEEAKWEADFLAKMQDSDGGFYFLVYPRNREYEDDVLPDHGDPQVVFPKTTSVTAAAVAALAETASSPRFKTQFPDAAALYMQKAQLGWQFLMNAIATYGKDGAYQKITHYGNEFGHNDELAWAAAAMYAATGDPSYQRQLFAWFPDPNDPSTRRWTWWRMFEGYGCAIRTYAFAARSGRLSATQLDPNYLSKCDAEILATAEDHVRFAQESAYADSFPDETKAYQTAGWFFSSERAFDVTVGYQVDPRPEFEEAVFSNLNYEGGCNPINMTYITGIGYKRQREIVSQYHENDRRVLPPSGLPLGNVQSGFPYLSLYQRELSELSFPADGATTAPYPYYDRWGDTFNTTTEAVVMDQARCLASLSFWMAQSPAKNQPWRSGTAQITGLPASAPAGQDLTASVLTAGLDLTNAMVVWEARDQEPQLGRQFHFTAKYPGDQWLEVEIQYPDGRRVFAATNFLATTSLDGLPNSFESAPVAVSTNTKAIFHLDGNLDDATGRHGPLQLQGQAALDSSNLGWMAQRSGAALRVNDLGDGAAFSFPAGELYDHTQRTAIAVDAMIYVNAFKAYNRQTVTLLGLNEAWNANIRLMEDPYTGLHVQGGSEWDVSGATITSALTLHAWHNVRLQIDNTGYSFLVDGQLVASKPSSELSNWLADGLGTLEIGNFDGWIDEVVIRSDAIGVAPPPGGAPSATPTVSLITPVNGTQFNAGADVALSATVSDPNGTVAKVEFYQGPTLLGEAGQSPFAFVWKSAPAGNYQLTARAYDVSGASGVSSPVAIDVAAAPPSALPAPTFTQSPNADGAVAITLQSSVAGASIYYTTDGSAPTPSATLYSGPFSVAGGATVQAISVTPDLRVSPVASFGAAAAAPSGANSAQFLADDDATEGSWKGTYGGDGFNVIGDVANYPAYAAVTPGAKTDYTWQDPVTDPRALQKSGAGTDRIAACWCANDSFIVDVKITDGQSHRLALYFLDWDNASRVQTIVCLDANTGAPLDQRTISNFSGGRYLSWKISGHLQFRLVQAQGFNAVLEGLFFDSPSNPAGPANGGPPASSNGLFVKMDPATQGNWIGVYGAAGYNIVGDSATSSPSVQVAASGKWDYSWEESTSDSRALQRADNSGRLAAGWYSASSFNVDISFADSNFHQLAVYLLDWDRQQRTEQVDVIDPQSGATLDSQTVSYFGDGKYLVWNLRGRVRIRFTNVAGPNAVLMGLFFDAPSAGVPLAAPGEQLLRLSTGDFQLNLSGASGHRYVIEASSDLKSWTPISTNAIAGGSTAVLDSQAHNYPRRFYRTRQIP